MSDYQTSLMAVVENSAKGDKARNAFVPLAIARLIENSETLSQGDILADLCRASGIKANKGGNYRATMLGKGSGTYTAFTNLKTIWDNRDYALNHVLAYGRYVPSQMQEHMGDELANVCGDAIAASKAAQAALAAAMDKLAAYTGDNSLTIASLKAEVTKAKGAATRAESACAAKVDEFASTYIAVPHNVPAIPASVNAMVQIVIKAKNKAKAASDASDASDASGASDASDASDASAGSVVLLPESDASDAEGQLAAWAMANPGQNIAVILKLARDCVASLDGDAINANLPVLAEIGDAIAALFASRANADTGKATGTNG